MRTPTFLLPLFTAAALSAQTPPDATALHQRLASDFRTVARIVEVSKELEHNRQVLQAIVESDIETLRDPRGDGNYRWAQLQREEESRATVEKSIEKVSTEQTLQTATVSALRAYRLEIAAPRKRNLVADNNRLFVRSAIVEWTGLDGKTSRSELPINVWVAPGDAHGVPLPEIARSAKATVALGVDSGNKKAVAKVSLLQAKLVDDPANPNFPAVQRLLNIQRLVAEDEIRRGDLRSAVDEALLALPGELEKRVSEQRAAAQTMRQMAESGTMKGSITLGDATPDVVAELDAIARLSGGTLEQQNEARMRLQALVEVLSPMPRE